MRVAVLTISDSVTKGEREDLSGPAVVAFCRGLGWEVTSSLRVSDDPANIREQLRAVADSGRVDVLLTTGGTAVRCKTLIVNLPGSPKGAVESLEVVAHLLPHAVKVLHGARHD